MVSLPSAPAAVAKGETVFPAQRVEVGHGNIRNRLMGHQVDLSLMAHLQDLPINAA
jgi:hypothetical protein